MATKKTKPTNKPMKLEPLDLGNLDDFLDDNPNPEIKKGGALRDLRLGFKKGFLEQTKVKTLMRSFLRTGIPDGYSRAFGAIDDAKRTADQIYQDVKQTNAADFDLIAEKAESLLPKLKGRLNDKHYQKIADSIASKREDFKYLARQPRNAAERARMQQMAQRQADEQKIQAELFSESESNADARFQAERAERGIRDKVSSARFNSIAQNMGIIADAASSEKAYRDQIGYTLQRKGVELQFRSYFALRDLVKYAETSLQVNKEAYEAIVRNTGLPDHLKSTSAEMVNFTGKRAAAKYAVDKLPDFLAQFMPQIQANLTGMARQGMSSLGMAMGAGDGMDLGQLKNKKWELLGQGLGALGGNYAKSKVMPFVSRKTKPHLERLSNKYLGGGHDLANYYMNNASSSLQDWTQDYENSVGGKGILQDFLRMVVPQYSLNNQLKEGGYHTIDKQAAFNQLTQRSITEIIPGYLSRLLQEVRMIRTGSDDVERETFDITKGKFTGMKNALKNQQDRIITTQQRTAVSGALNDALSKFDEQGELSPEARAALSERILRDSATNGRFDPGQYANAAGYRHDTAQTTTDELRKFFANKFELDANGKTVRNAANNGKLNQYSDAFLNVRNVTGDPRTEIKRLFGSGNHEMLRELGLVINENGMDRINYDKVWELYRTDVPGGPGGGGPGGGGPGGPGGGPGGPGNGPGGPGGPGDVFDPNNPPPPGSNTIRILRDKVKQAEDAAKRRLGGLRDQAADRGFDRAYLGGLAAKVKGKMPAFNTDAVLDRIRSIKMPDVDRTKLLAMIGGLQLPNMPPVNKQMLTQMLSSVRMPTVDRQALLAMLPDAGQAKLQFAGMTNRFTPRQPLALPHLDALRERGGAMMPSGLPSFNMPGLPGFQMPTFNLQGLPSKASLGEHLSKLGDRLPKVDLDMIRDTASRLPKLDKKELAVYGALGRAKGQEVIKKLLGAGEQGMACIKGLLESGMVTGESMYQVATDPKLVDDVTSQAIALGSSLRSQAQNALGSDPVSKLQLKLAEGKDVVVGKAGAAAEVVNDLYVKGTNELAIRAADLEAGNLIDATSKQVITKLEDIKGTVIDKAGNVRVTAAQLGRGLVDAYGEVKALVPFKGAMAWAGKQYAAAAGAYWTWLAGNFQGKNALMGTQGVQDLYLPGRKEPVLLARDIEAGLYINQETNRPIESLDDITGPVVDQNAQVVLTSADIEKGLYTAQGGKVKLSRFKILSGVIKAGLSPATTLIKAQLWLAKKVATIAIKSVMVLDAYLPGVKEPLLRSSVLKNGGYFYADGRPIRSFDDLRDGVFDERGNELVSAEEIPHLINRDGSKHTAAKRRSLVRKWGKKILTAPFKAVGRGYMKLTKGYYNWLGSKFSGGRKGKAGQPLSPELQAIIAKRGGKGTDPIGTPTDALLANIAQTLDRRLPKEAPTEGSWQQQLAEREALEAQARAKKAAKDPRDPKGKKEKGLLERLAAKLGAGKAAGEEEEGGGIGDINIGEGEEKDKPRSRRDRARDRLRRRKEAKYGRFRKGILRGGRAVMNSGVGRAAGSLGMNAARLGATALLGEGAVAALGTGASMLGGGLASAGGALATGATAIAGILSAPVVLGVLGVAAVGAGAYWLYSRDRDSSGDFREFRLDQYGIGNDSTSRALKILNLEAALEASASKGAEPQLNISAENASKLVDIVGLDMNDPQKLAEFGKWVDLRFKPVFFTYLRAMKTMGLNCKVNELDDKLLPEQKAGFLELVRMSTGADSPYAFTASPFADGDPLTVTAEQVTKHYEELKAKFAKDAPSKDTTKTAETEKSTGAAAVAAGAAAVGATGAVNAAAAASGVPAPSNVIPFVAKGTGPSTGVMGKLTAGTASVTAFTGNKVSALQAIRMRAYGLFGLSVSRVSALMSIEEIVFAGVQTSTGGLSEFTGDQETFLDDAATALGFNIADPASQERVDFINWVQYRFMPVVLTYCSAVKNQDASIQMARVEQGMSAIGKVGVANALIAATSDYNDDKVSVWKVPSILLPTAPEQVMLDLAKADLKALQDEADKVKLNTPTQSGAAQNAAANGGSAAMVAGAEMAGSKSGAESGGFLNGVNNFVAGVEDSISNAASKVGDSISSAASGAKNTVKGWLGMDDNKPSTPGGTIGGAGNVTAMAKGNGGSWESVPMPTAKTRAGCMPSFLKIQDLSGMDANLLATFASIESNFNWEVKASTSSATGWFQFINATWDYILKLAGGKYGCPQDDGARSLRKDPRINGLMGAEYIKLSYETLSKGLGRAPTDTDLYMAHFLGPGTAVKFLKMDKNTDAVNAFPQQAGANKSIFFKKGGSHNTCGEVYAIMDAKVAKHRGAGGTSVTKQVLPGDTDPVAAAEAQAKATAASAADGIQQTPGLPNAANDPSAAAPNLSQATNATVNPLNAQAATGTAGTQGTSGAPNAPVGSGQDDPTLQASQNAQMQQAQAQDKTRAAQVQDQQAASKSAMDIQSKQLDELVEMKGYLKTIADNMGLLKPSGTSQVAPASSGNAIDNSAPQRTDRSVGQGRPPLQMTR
jgi:hypothetical protein